MNNNDKLAKIIKELNQVVIPEMNDKIDNINNGGCGVFAYLLIKRLRELGINAIARELEQYDNTDEFTDERTGKTIHPSDPLHSASNFFKRVSTKKITEKRLTPSNPEEIGWFHIEVELDEENKYFLIDGTEIKAIDKKDVGYVLQKQDLLAKIFGQNTKMILGDIVPFELLEKIQEYDIWNDKFDKKQIPLIEKILQKDLV